RSRAVSAALALVHVAEVDSHRLDVDQHLTGAWRRVRHFLELEDFGSPVAFEGNCPHLVISSERAGCGGLSTRIVATIRASRAPKVQFVARIRSPRVSKPALVATIRVPRAPTPALVATIHEPRVARPGLVATIRLLVLRHLIRPAARASSFVIQHPGSPSCTQHHL